MQDHTGENLAEVFVEILEDFKLTDKVCTGQHNREETLTRALQILSITCDNASNNDTMIDAIADAMDCFPGEANCTWCFAHITNLVAKSLLKQFDVLKKKLTMTMSKAEHSLQELADEINLEEVQTCLKEMEDNRTMDKDDEEGLINEVATMSNEEREAWEEQVCPAKTVLVKV